MSDPAGQGGEGEEIRFGRSTLSRARRTLAVDGTAVKLGSRAFDLLAILAEHRGQVVGKAEMMARAWPGLAVEEVGLRVHMAAVRRALANDPDCNVEAEPGVGYRLLAPWPAQVPASPSTQGGFPIIGRSGFLDMLGRSLAQNVLTTIVGPGGVGKTTVARAAAQASMAEFPDGVCFVDLVAVSAELVADTVARALGLAVFAGSPAPGIIAHLRARRMVLVLDTCEHVLDAVAALTESLVEAAPRAHILATSREPLRIQGEHVHRLPGLETPPPGPGATLETLQAFSAPALFLDRAGRGGGQVAGGDAATVISICERLDGLPMAIEIVAAQVATFGVDGVAGQISAQFALAARGRRTALARHHTIQATLDWSYGLLSPGEQAALRALGVFPARFCLESARQVIGDGASLAAAAQLVGDLVAKSLVSASEDEALPYRLLDTTRAYARQALRAAGEDAAASRRHAAYCLAALDRAASGVILDRVARTMLLDDVRAALDWCFGPTGDIAFGIELTSASVELWTSLALFEEHRAIVERALGPLAAMGLAGGRTEMTLRLALGNILYHNGGMALDEATDGAFRRALVLARLSGSPGDRIKAMSGLIAHGTSRGDYAGNLELEADLMAFDGPLAGIANRALGHTLVYHGDFAAAEAALTRAMPPDIAKPSASGSGVSYDHITVVKTVRARLVWLVGSPREALVMAAEAVENASRVDPPISLCLTLATSALFVASMSGRDAQAEAYLVQLETHATRHSMRRWSEYARAYRLALRPREARTAEEAVGFDAIVASANGALLECLAVMGDERTTPGLVSKAMGGQAGWCRAELIRADTRNQLAAGSLNHAEAERRLIEALDLARRQGIKSWQLRIGADLARLQHARGSGHAARAMLGPILDNASDRLSCPDLAAAEAVFAQLDAPSPPRAP